MKDAKPIESLYPDLVQEGGLLAVVRQRLGGKLTGLEINGFGTGQGYVWIQTGSRASQMFLRLDERKFDFDFYQDRQAIAVGTTPDLDEALAAILNWLSTSSSADGLLAEFSFIQRKVGGIPPVR